MNAPALAIRKDILRVAVASRHGHIPSCFSVVEILLAVYARMRHDPVDPDSPDRDLFILSKGHAALAHYCVLARAGYFTAEDILTLGEYGSSFGCHADRRKIPGVEASTGSLGHGAGLAVGMALGSRILGSGRHVYTLVGDGEANEGSIWEAALVAESLGLANLTVIYDGNMSHSRGLQVPNPGKKFAAFGFTVFPVNGHDPAELDQALAARAPGPKAIIARTEKGHGCPTLVENHYAWHGKIPDDEQLSILLRELDASSI